MIFPKVIYYVRGLGFEPVTSSKKLLPSSFSSSVRYYPALNKQTNKLTHRYFIQFIKMQLRNYLLTCYSMSGPVL